MPVSRIIECIAGISAALLAIFLFVYSEIRELEMDRQNQVIQYSVTTLLFGFFILVVPGVSVGIGSYAHSLKQRKWGYSVLLIAASVNNFLIVAFFVGIVWSYPGWAVLLFIIQFFLVLIAVAAGYFQQTQSNKALQLTAR